MGQNFILNNEYFLKINSISNSNTQKINSEIKFRHFIVFCGKGLNSNLLNTINLLANLTKNNELYIGLTDRGDLDDYDIDDSIYKISLNIEEINIPNGFTSENYLISELNSISYFIENLFNHEVLFFSKIRKDIFLDINVFINYLNCVPSLKKKYRYICAEDSTNLMRINCLSDIFFTMDIEEFLSIKIPYRYKNKNPILSWFWYRQPYEIFKNDHQAEQWLWKNIFFNSDINFSLFGKHNSYFNFLEKNFLILSSQKIGYNWTRGSKFKLYNESRFVPKGKYLFNNTKPPTDFVSYNSFLSKIVGHDNFQKYINIYKIIVLIKKSFIFIIKLPFYWIKYLSKNYHKL